MPGVHMDEVGMEGTILACIFILHAGCIMQHKLIRNVDAIKLCKVLMAHAML